MATILREQLDAAEKQLAAKDAELAALRSEVARLISERDAAEARVTALEGACLDVESKIADYAAGKINWRPDDFLFRVRAALAKEYAISTRRNAEVIERGKDA